MLQDNVKCKMYYIKINKTLLYKVENFNDRLFYEQSCKEKLQNFLIPNVNHKIYCFFFKNQLQFADLAGCESAIIKYEFMTKKKYVLFVYFSLHIYQRRDKTIVILTNLAITHKCCIIKFASRFTLTSRNY